MDHGQNLGGQMKISVALASYNGANFIAEQLRSLAAQTHLPDELIVTDDGSDDETIRIITDFARTAPFDVKLFQNPQRLGFGHNFGKALALCSGDIVFLCDQDDSWLPEKIKLIIELAQDMPNIQLFMNDAIIADADLRPTAFTLLGQTLSLGRSPEELRIGCCSAVKRDLLQICLPIPEPVLWHDTWAARIAESCSTKYVLDQPLQYYRRHKNNASSGLWCLQRKITHNDKLSEHFAFGFAALRSVFKKSRPPGQVAIIENWLRIRLAQARLTQSKNVVVVNEAAIRKIRDEARRARLRRFVRSLPLSRRPIAIVILLRRNVYPSSRLRRCLRDLLG